MNVHWHFQKLRVSIAVASFALGYKHILALPVRLSRTSSAEDTNHGRSPPIANITANGGSMPATGNSKDRHDAEPLSESPIDSTWVRLADKYWRNTSKPPKVDPRVVKLEIWEPLEREGFQYGALLGLEQLQILEGYLWPGFSSDATNQHVLLLALVAHVKRRQGLPMWDCFSKQPADFSTFFRRVLLLSIDITLSLGTRTHLISFLIDAFQSLDNSLVRKQCAPLVSISIWHNLQSDPVRSKKLEKSSLLQKAWRASNKRYETGDDETRGRLQFERSWLFTLLLDFLQHTYNPSKHALAETTRYCERFLELLSDLLGQLPTRRYVNTLLQDLNLFTILKFSTLYNDESNGLFRDLLNLFRHFLHFPVDDHNGQQLSIVECQKAHYATLNTLQKIAITHFEKNLRVLALTNLGSLGNRAELAELLESLSDDELLQLCERLYLRTEYPATTGLGVERDLALEILLDTHERRKDYRSIVAGMPNLPTEHTIYEPTFLRTEAYDSSHPLAVPKLNLQYLTVGDFLWRSYILYRCEAFYAIRKDVEETLKRLQLRWDGNQTRIDGFSRLALSIPKPAITHVQHPNVGEDMPAQVRAEIILDVSKANFGVRREWENLRQDDVVFLLAAQASAGKNALTNGHTVSSAAESAGIKYMRCAEVVTILDEKGKPLRESRREENSYDHRVRQRRIIVRLDPKAYHEDQKKLENGGSDIYESINVLVRRRARENNFKPVLETIKQLISSDVPSPSWFQDVFLGYGDPAGASYKHLPNQLSKLDFCDTFLNWQHLVQSFPEKEVRPNDDTEGSFGPPYLLQTTIEEKVSTEPPRKKRRRDQIEVKPEMKEIIEASTYEPPNAGPYPSDATKLNTVCFTPAQVEAIVSGTQPGLTVVVGPPGTGKTDVATQIINNIYHNFPTQRTLLIAHSNQALNQLFQKIVALDIDERHLLRLGHGEEELETNTSFSKHGRVESFMENGARYLAEVQRLADSIGAPGAHGSSCETADYFNSVYVKPLWAPYKVLLESRGLSKQETIAAFPFQAFFSNAPQPIFPDSASLKEIVYIAQGCYRHIEKIFSELEDIRPFEILRREKDKADYLLIKEARIIAMTSTHAAMRRQEIAGLGFHYENVVMEEAAQITEIENFIPLALQKPKDDVMPLQRIILCGDHLQNSPIIQNLAFRQHANLEQSLFLRLVRLGVPTIMLDRQGRARPSIAELYKWRYPNLGNLPNVESEPEFLSANSGLRFDYQFIDVPDFNGKGEMEPTPHFIQNLGEAEYVVALYMYMRLLGYPSSKISILTAYAGQRALIKDVLQHRCAQNRLFGLPRIVTTVDKYQGEQNDYVLLSLVRTTRPGFMRDIRRLTVALSRARLGMYVFGRRAVFESVPELRTAFNLLFQRPDTLQLVTGEMFPTSRLLEDDVTDRTAEMAGLEHLGQYVVTMTQAKIEDLKRGAATLTPADQPMEDDEDEGEGAADLSEEDDEEEPEEEV